MCDFEGLQFFVILRFIYLCLTIQLFVLNIGGHQPIKKWIYFKEINKININVVVIQEKHVASENDFQIIGNIDDYSLLGATYHKTYGAET